MKYIVKQKVLWLVILMLLLSIDTLELVQASGIGAYSVYDNEKSCLTHICVGSSF